MQKVANSKTTVKAANHSEQDENRNVLHMRNHERRLKTEIVQTTFSKKRNLSLSIFEFTGGGDYRLQEDKKVVLIDIMSILW